MRKLYAILLFFPLLTWSQNRIEWLIASEPVQVDRVTIIEDDNHLYVPSSFGKHGLSDSEVLSTLSNRTVFKVQLVYTQYRTSQSFDQQGLNRKRCEKLFAEFPFLFENELIELELVEQTGCKSRKEGKGFFHGYIITCGEEQSEELLEEEMAFLDALFEGEDATCPVKIVGEEEVFSIPLSDRMPFYADGDEALVSMMSGCIRYPFDAVSQRLYGTSEVKIEIKSDGTLGKVSVGSGPIAFNPEILKGVECMEAMEPAILDGDYVGSTVDIVVKFNYSDKSADVVNASFSSNPFPYGSDFLTEENVKGGKINLSATVVTKTLKRNKWSDVIVVADVTGSMSPFTGQIIQYLYETIEQGNVRKVAFFNDGNNKPTPMKFIGKTGGVYVTDSCELLEVKKTLKKAMSNGSGGELPENDIEAVLEASAQCEDCKSIVLIADNYAPVRDVKLMKKVDKPVHVVVCNMARMLNVDYLNLALITKGSVHVRGKDYYDLDQYSEENPLIIEGTEFKLINGLFTFDQKPQFTHPMVKP
jgi:hypothetical protein